MILRRAVVGTSIKSHGFRTPPYSEVNQGFTNLAFGYTALPNPDLKPESSDTVELGLRGTFGRTSWYKPQPLQTNICSSELGCFGRDASRPSRIDDPHAWQVGQSDWAASGVVMARTSRLEL